MTPKTVDEFLDMVDQAIYEIDELLLCAGDEGDPDDFEFSELVPLYEHLKGQLEALHEAVQSGSHRFADGSDLPFMAVARKWKARLPFRDVLDQLNQSHRAGF